MTCLSIVTLLIVIVLQLNYFPQAGIAGSRENTAPANNSAKLNRFVWLFFKDWSEYHEFPKTIDCEELWGDIKYKNCLKYLKVSFNAKKDQSHDFCGHYPEGRGRHNV